MENEKEITCVNDLSLRGILTLIFEWSLHKDEILYTNLDKHFCAFTCRRGLTEKEKNYVRQEREKEDLNTNDLLIKALAKSDYVDYFKFIWTFKSVGEANKFIAYTKQDPNPYEWFHTYLDAHVSLLSKKKLNYWFKSDDHNKYRNYRKDIQRKIDSNDFSTMYLMEKSLGDSKVRNMIRFTYYDSMLYNIVLQHILDNNIVPDIHNESLTFQTPFEKSSNNRRLITQSSDDNQFSHFIYLSAFELKRIYEKHKLVIFDDSENAVFKYIEALDDDTSDEYQDSQLKFFLYLT